MFRDFLYIAALAAAVGWVLVLLKRASPGPADARWRRRYEKHLHFAEINGLGLRYLDCGTGPVVLFIHGFGDNLYTWFRNLPAFFQAGWRTAALDLPGMGESDRDPDRPPSPGAWAETIVGLMDHLGVDRFYAVGNSLGGHLCLYLALEHKERIAGMVPVDPACYPGVKLDLLRGLARWKGMAPLIQALIGPAVYRLGLAYMYHHMARMAPGEVGETAMTARRPDWAANLVDTARCYFGEPFTEAAGRLHRISTPALIVWGANDRALAPKRFARRLQRDIGARLAVIEDVGHMPHRETPDIFNTLVLDFLGECERRAGGQRT